MVARGKKSNSYGAEGSALSFLVGRLFLENARSHRREVEEDSKKKREKEWT